MRQEISTRDAGEIDAFLKAVSAATDTNAYLGFAALRSGGELVLLQARVIFHARVLPILGRFETQNLVVAGIRLSELAATSTQLIHEFFSGTLRTPIGDVRFPPDNEGRHAALYTSLHPDGLQRQRRIGVLKIGGADHPAADPAELDWEIKAAPEPYDGLIDVMNRFQILPFHWGASSVEFVLLPAAQIDDSTAIKGDNAAVVVQLAKGLDRNLARVPYRIQSDTRTVVERGSINGATMDWSNSSEAQLGRYSLPVPKGSIVNLVAVYNDVAHHHWWVVDPAASPNARRTVYEAFDPRLEILLDVLEKARGRGPDARNFEAAIAWIFWMLGFETLNIGSTPRTSEAPDIIATTPGGRVLVVEVTTGLPKTEHKLAILHDRTEHVRRCLAGAGRGHVRVVPVLVTSKTREEARVDGEQVEKAGVFMITAEDIPPYLNRTVLNPDPDRTFEEVERAVSINQVGASRA